jgi:hypothetical protein
VSSSIRTVLLGEKETKTRDPKSQRNQAALHRRFGKKGTEHSNYICIPSLPTLDPRQNTLSRHFRGTTTQNGAEPVEKRTATRSNTNTGTVTGKKRGPEPEISELQESVDGPTDHDTSKDEDLGKDNMTTISSFQVSPADLMEQTPFHHFGMHDDKFDPTAFPNTTFEFPSFPDPPPPAGNPLFDEKETAFMSSFFDTVDQNTSFDHDFQDGLAQWTVPSLEMRKAGFEDVWNTQPNVTNGASNHNYTPTTAYGQPHYDPMTSEQSFPAPSFPKQTQNLQSVVQHLPQQYNPSPPSFLSHAHSSSHNPNDLQRSVFTHRNPSQSNPSQCESLFSGYPSLNMPVASPSAAASANHTPNTTPKLAPYNFLKNEISSSESPPSTANLNRLVISHPTQSNYAPSSCSSSNSPQTSHKPPRKKRRENLSEQQKRINHITSEQKRRNLIQQGFNEIHSLVPALRGQRERGDSKSTVLLKTVDFLEELREGNDRLQRMLNSKR